MRRRSFLRLLAASSAALGIGSRTHASRTPRVVVVGGGPAGVSAAVELAQRGARVTLLEAEDRLGGKARGFQGTLDGEPVDEEVGLHGVWHQYLHLRDLVERYGLSRGLGGPDGTAAIRWPGEELHNGDLGSRISLSRRFIERARRKGHSRTAMAAMQGRRIIRGLNPRRARRELAGRSAGEWIRGDAPLTFFSVFAQELSRSRYLLEPDDLDAATFAMGDRFYRSGGPRNSEVQWWNGNPHDRLWGPLAEVLEELGTDLRFGVKARDLIWRRDRVVGVRVGERQPGAWVETLPVGWTRVDRPGELPPFFLHRGENDRLRGFSGGCTHGPRHLELETWGFFCSGHGCRYDFDGAPVAGPARAHLEQVHVEEGADGIYVEGEDRGESLVADAIILAVPPPALSHLAGRMLPTAADMQSCNAVVGRFWLDTDVNPKSRSSVVLAGLPYASTGFLVHRLQDAARAWAEAHGGSVVELQAFCNLPRGLARKDLLDLLEGELRTAWPELARATVLKRSLGQGRDFTLFAPGWQAHAIPVDPGIPGLLVAGDHVDIDHECQFMERAVLSGRMAANEVLERFGLPVAPILPSG